METLTILSWIWGEDPSKIIKVDIEGTKSVAALKQAIKMECAPGLDAFPVYDLKIFEVSITEDDLKQKLRDAPQKPEDIGGAELSLTRQVAAVFPESLVDAHIQIIVVPPTGTRSIVYIPDLS